jgi:glycosyltransferase involved in cell wall biosynthesis
MYKSVTIGIPIYRRLQHLRHVLDVVASQDYPNIQLLVSDNGQNGQQVHEAVRRYYARPNRVRQNPATVPMSLHFNQIINEAEGEYFVLLADDDEISSNYVSELVRALEHHRASVAMGVLETIDEAGTVVRRSKDSVPEVLSGQEFVRAMWDTCEYGYESFSTFLARTADLVKCGGFPDFWKGRGNDDALVVKLSLDNAVAFSTRCAYRKRFYASSYGFSIPTQDLARGMSDFLKFLDSDPVLRQFSQHHPDAWKEAKRILVRMIWKSYYFSWTDREETGLSRAQWVRAGFALPFVREYYTAVARTLASTAWAALKRRRNQLFTAR